MTPLVTIGIPCFNGVPWVRGAIESALSQTASSCEVIVVDDGSTDGSIEVIREFGAKVRLIAIAHGGANRARNVVLENARGAWIQYLDADDYLEPEKIAQQLTEASHGAEADAIYSPVWIETTTGRAIERTVSKTSPRSDIFVQWISWQIPQNGGCLWRKEALAALGGWKEGLPCCQEHELYLRALEAGQRFVFAPTPHAVYRVWSEETLCRKDPRLVVSVKTALIDKLHAWLSERRLWTSEHARVAGQACLEMARTLAKYDRTAARDYHRERKQRGLIHLEGPAAPPAYQLVYHLFGFTVAEKLAAARR